jgi:ribose transport system substrate-binding protein
MKITPGQIDISGLASSGRAFNLAKTQLAEALRVCAYALFFCALLLPGCRSRSAITIAVIPRTAGNYLWEPVHGGAEVGALQTGSTIYWNAPTREDDIEGQIALVNQVVARGYQGLVLAPDQALALITPVRRALARGMPTVVVSSQLPIPAGGKLFYILNNEDSAAGIAADRVLSLLHHHGPIAVLGVNPDVAGIITRVRSFEQDMTQIDPGITLIKKMGTFNFLHEQQVSEETLKASPDVEVIVALNWASARGAIAAIENSPELRNVKVVAFDPDGAPPFNLASLDSVILQNTRGMGQKAVEEINAELRGEPVPAVVKLEPKLVTRENINSPEVQQWTSMDWRAIPWKWSTDH